MEIVASNKSFNLFKQIKCLPKKEEQDITLLLLGSMLNNILYCNTLSEEDKVNECKHLLKKHGLNKER